MRSDLFCSKGRCKMAAQVWGKSGFCNQNSSGDMMLRLPRFLCTYFGSDFHVGVMVLVEEIALQATRESDLNLFICSSLLERWIVALYMEGHRVRIRIKLSTKYMTCKLWWLISLHHTEHLEYVANPFGQAKSSHDVCLLLSNFGFKLLLIPGG